VPTGFRFGKRLLRFSVNFKVPCKVKSLGSGCGTYNDPGWMGAGTSPDRTSLYAYSHGLATSRSLLKSPNRCLSSASSRQVRLIPFSVADNGKIINPIGNLPYPFLIGWLYPNSARILENRASRCSTVSGCNFLLWSPGVACRACFETFSFLGRVL
jgi:hypothetical protein